MKFHMIKKWRSPVRTLRVTLTGREAFDYEMAEWLRQRPSPLLPDFTYRLKGDSAVLFYDLTGSMKLSSFLKARISLAQYSQIITSIADVTDACTAASVPAECIVWDRKRIFVRPSLSAILYIVLPIRNMAPPKTSANTLMMFLSDPRKVHFPSQGLEGVRSDYAGVKQAGLRQDQASSSLGVVRDYVRRHPIFSSITMRDWMLQKGVIDRDFAPAPSTSAPSAFPSQPGTAPMAPTPPAATSVTSPTPATPLTSATGNGPTWGRTLPARPTRGIQQSWDPVQAVFSGRAGQTGQISQAHQAGSGAPVVPSPLSSNRFGASLSDASVQAGSPAAVSFFVTRLRDDKTVHLSQKRASIGRSATADIHMGGDPSISRVHAFLEYKGDSMFDLVDNHAPNGTFVNGSRLPSGGRAVLKSGDVFSLSDVEFQIMVAVD